MSASQPWMKFYPQDWRADEKLRMCSLASRGLWIEMLAIMHRSERYGQLLISGRVPTDAQLAVQVGALPDQVTSLLAELEEAGVFSRAVGGAIYSRRMTRDHKKAENSRRNGKKGGNPLLTTSDRKSKRKTGQVNLEDKLADKGQDKAQIPEARNQNKPPNPLSGDQGEETPEKIFWDEAKGYLGPDKASQIGKWLREFGMPAIRRAIEAAKAENDGAGPGNRIAFVAAILRNDAAREAQRLKTEQEQRAAFDRRFPERVISEDEARLLMPPLEFEQWLARKREREIQNG